MHQPRRCRARGWAVLLPRQSAGCLDGSPGAQKWRASSGVRGRRRRAAGRGCSVGRGDARIDRRIDANHDVADPPFGLDVCSRLPHDAHQPGRWWSPMAPKNPARDGHIEWKLGRASASSRGQSSGRSVTLREYVEIGARLESCPPRRRSLDMTNVSVDQRATPLPPGRRTLATSDARRPRGRRR